MYILKTEHSFDSAHFLSGYKGKCSNIHGHRWRVEFEIKSDSLIEGGQTDGMIIDFGDFKKSVKDMLDFYDHALIIEKDTMRKETLDCIKEDGFRVITVDFRPTAENFSRFFFYKLKSQGYKVHKTTVYETPTNSASYQESELI